MKNYKNIIGIMALIWLPVFLNGCSLFTFTDPIDDSSSSGESITIETDAAIQEGYRKQWLENTKGIKKGAYTGEPDLWGGGSFGEIEMWFNNKEGEESKYLWYHSQLFPEPEIAYRLASERGKPAFVDGQTAILYVTATTSDLMRNTIFIFQVKDGKIYRTKSAWGFGGVQGGTKVDNWDLTIPKEEFDKLIVVNESKVAPTPGNIILNVGKQTEYKKQWLANTKNITMGTYKIDEVDIAGVPWKNIFMWFQDEKLYYTTDADDSSKGEDVYRLLTDDINTTDKKITFINGNTAIMHFYAEPFFPGWDDAKQWNLYIVKVENDKIYRTKNAKSGFDNLNTWDGEKVPRSALDNLVIIAEKIK